MEGLRSLLGHVEGVKNGVNATSTPDTVKDWDGRELLARHLLLNQL